MRPRRSAPDVLVVYRRPACQESAVVVMQKWLDPERERAFREAPDAH